MPTVARTHAPQEQTMPSERSSLLSNPSKETEPYVCDQSILSEALSFPFQTQPISVNVRQQNVCVNTDNESENECIQPIDGNDLEQERFVQPMQAVGGNHYDGFDVIRDQTAGKLYC